jgi:tetratricopeptide (TPR) repeat protein
MTAPSLLPLATIRRRSRPAAEAAGTSTVCSRLATAVVIVALVPSLVHAQQAGRVRLTSGVEVPGEIVALSPNGVDVETDGKVRKFSIESLKEVRFDDEPEALRDARGLLLRNDAAAALAELATIDPGEINGLGREIRAELAFVTSAATARRALSTGENLAAAQKTVGEFLATHPRSHHLYAMQEILGDLIARQGNPAQAAAAYGLLEKGPPAIATRAAILQAALLYRQQSYAEALRDYESASRNATNAAATGLAESQDPLQRGLERARAAGITAAKREADLGRARCLARLGKADEAITIVRGVLADADPDDDDGLGRIFNALGDAQRTAGELASERSGERDRDALISFLTVALVHNTVPAEHAEALFNLVELWERNNNPERARAARRTLEATYPESPWTTKLPPPTAP